MTKPSKLYDVAKFYAHLRSKNCRLFGSSLSQNQVNGMEGILAAFAAEGDASSHSLAYIFATAYHETGRKMIPVREGFAKTDAGSIRAVTSLYNRGKISTNYALPDPETGKSYFGRGHVQLTWARNYQKMGAKISADLYRNPDLALDPVISAKVLVRGSLDGDFTGKCLDDYLPSDPKGARRVINGLDKASQIAAYHRDFLVAIEAAGGLVETVLIKPKPTASKNDAQVTLNGEVTPENRNALSALIDAAFGMFSRLIGGGKNG